MLSAKGNSGSIGFKQAMASLKWYEYVLLLLMIAICSWVVVRGVSVQSDRLDGKVIYIAGRALVDGNNPYSPSIMAGTWAKVFNQEFPVGQIFANPPTFLPFVYILGLFASDHAYRMIDCVNIACFIALLISIALWMKEFDPTIKPWRLLLGLTGAALPAAISINFTYGQTSLLVICGLLWGLYLLKRNKLPGLFGLCVIIASIKPQLSVMPLFVMMLVFRQLRFWVAACVSLLVWMLLVGFWQGFQVYTDFIAALANYQTYDVNNNAAMSGLSNLLSFVGLKTGAGFAIAVFALCLCVIFGLKRLLNPPHREPAIGRRTTEAMLIVMVILLNEFFMPLHVQDHSILMFSLAMVFVLPPVLSILLIPGLLVAARPIILMPFIGNHIKENELFTLAFLWLALASAIFYIKPPVSIKKLGRE